MSETKKAAGGLGKNASPKRPEVKTGWHASKAHGRSTLVEKYGTNGRMLNSFIFRFDEDGDGDRLAKLLNRLDKPKARAPRAPKTDV